MKKLSAAMQSLQRRPMTVYPKQWEFIITGQFQEGRLTIKGGSVHE